MKARSNTSPIIRSQKNDVVSATKAIIETHISTKCYYNYSERIIEQTTTRIN